MKSQPVTIRNSIPAPRPETVLTKAVVAVAAQLQLKNRELAAMLGLSEANTSRSAVGATSWYGASKRNGSLPLNWLNSIVPYCACLRPPMPTSTPGSPATIRSQGQTARNYANCTGNDQCHRLPGILQLSRLKFIPARFASGAWFRRVECRWSRYWPKPKSWPQFLASTRHPGPSHCTRWWRSVSGFDRMLIWQPVSGLPEILECSMVQER